MQGCLARVIIATGAARPLVIIASRLWTTRRWWRRELHPLETCFTRGPSTLTRHFLPYLLVMIRVAGIAIEELGQSS